MGTKDYKKGKREHIKQDDLNKTSIRIISNLSSYLEFINLYKKERPFELQSLVEKIVKEERSIVERIRKIDRIDNRFHEGKDVVSKDLDESAGKRDIRKPTEAIKLIQGTFLNYLLFDRQKLIKFGVRTRTIDFDFLGLKKRKSDYAISFWKASYSDIKQFLYKKVNHIVLNGWMVLEPLEYNIVVAFYKFLSRFVRVGALVEQDNSYYRNVKIMDLFIEPYLVILYSNEYREILKETLLKILFSHTEHKKNLRKAISIVDNITNVQNRNLSFLNVILALYSLCYNRLVNYPDLIAHYDIKAIREDHFDFSQKVLHNVHNAIREMEVSVKEIEDELFILKYIEELDDTEDIKEDSWLALFKDIANYEYHSKKTDYFKVGQADLYDEKTFNMLKENVFFSIIRVSKGFVVYYKSILCDYISIGTAADCADVKIFDRLFLKDEFDTLERLIKEASELINSSSSSKLSIDNYYTYIDSRELSLIEEEKLCKIIEQIIIVYKNIAYKLYHVILLNKNTNNNSAEELLEQYKSKDEAITEDIHNLKSRLIPYASRVILFHPFLEGKQVIKVINEIVFFSVNLIYFFRESDITIRYNEKDKLIEEVEKFINIKGKVFL